MATFAVIILMIFSIGLTVGLIAAIGALLEMSDYGKWVVIVLAILFYGLFEWICFKYIALWFYPLLVQ